LIFITQLAQQMDHAIASNNTQTIEEVLKAVDKLNSRLRKCLGFKTPYEVFSELTGLDARMLAMGIR